MIIERTSPLTGRVHQMDIDVIPEQMLLYQRGELLEKAFPQLSADEREFIHSGITAEEWDTYMGGDDE